MSKSLKSKSSLFAALAAIAILASLLSAVEPGTRASHQDSAPARIGSSQEKVKEVSGIVKTVDLEKGQITVELSGEDSRRLGGMTEAKIQIEANTKIKDVNNSKTTISSITEHAPIEIKLAVGSDIANTPEVTAAKVELLIACTKSQGCEDSGECARACSSDVCACPKSKSSSSPSTP
jgi:Cu/Ag efflux protein CusF